MEVAVAVYSLFIVSQLLVLSLIDDIGLEDRSEGDLLLGCPMWARERCRISPPRFMAECCKRQLNQGSFVLPYFRLFAFSDLY